MNIARLVVLVILAACASAPDRITRITLLDPPGRGDITLRQPSRIGILHRPPQATGWVETDAGGHSWRFSLTQLVNPSQATHARLALQLELLNTESGAVLIPWDLAALAGPGGRTYRVIHRGVRLMDRNAPQAPSVIPPGEVLDDFVFPVDLIHYSGWYRGWTYREFFEALQPGQEFTLHLPVQVDGVMHGQTFRFRVSE